MKICPNCKEKVSDTYNHCPTCGIAFAQYPTQPQFQHGNITAKKSKAGIIAVIIVGAFLFVGIVAAAIIIPTSSVENQRALSLYDKAYTSLYSNDRTYTSEETAKLIGQARSAASSILVLSDTKKQIEELYKTAGDYTLLGEAEQAIASNSQSTAQSKLDQIEDSEVKRSSRYLAVIDQISIMQFKSDNKGSIQKAMSELYSSDSVNSWRMNYSVNCFCGYVTLFSSNSQYVEIILEDYNNQTHYLNFYYNKNSSTDAASWNTSVDEIKSNLQNGKKCVMAVAVVSPYNYPDKIISFSSIYS